MGIIDRLKQARDVMRGRAIAVPQPGRKQSGRFHYGDGLRYLSGTQINYMREIGNPLQSPLIVAPTQFLWHALIEAPIEVREPVPDPRSPGKVKYQTVDNHPMTQLLNQFNGAYTSAEMWYAWAVSWNTDGNAYWWKDRGVADVSDTTSQIKSLWYLPHKTIEPKWEGSQYVSYYRYTPDPRRPLDYRDIPPENIIHFRRGLDPTDVDRFRKGINPLYTVCRDVYYQIQSANVNCAVMRNNGVLPAAFWPKQIAETKIDPETGAPTEEVDLDVAGFKEQLAGMTTGDRAGNFVVFSAPMECEKLGIDPSSVDLSRQQRVPEEHVAATYAIPPAILNFGAGLEHLTKANYEQADERAYEGCVLPVQTLICRVIQHRLLSEFEPANYMKMEVGFDLSKIRALQDDETDMARRSAILYNAGLIKRSEGREMNKRPFDSKDEFYKYELEPQKGSTAPAPTPGPEPNPEPDSKYQM